MSGRITQVVIWLRSVDGITCVAVLALALVVRLIIAPNLIISQDLMAFGYWGELMNQDFLHVYSVGASNSSWTLLPTYLPVALYLFGFMVKVYFGLGALLGIPLSHDVATAHMLKIVLKTPEILADLVFLAILYVKAIRVMPRWVAWLASATYALSPGVLITSVIWGQTDGIILLLVVIALLATLRNEAIWAGAVMALAISFKPQPFIFVPLILVYLLRWGGVKHVARGVAAFVGVTFVVWLPYLLPPFTELHALRKNISATLAAEMPTATHSAFNLWWALGIGHESASTPFLGPFTITQVGEGLFGIILLIVAIGIWRDRSQGRLWAGAAILALAFFTIGTLQFERYMFPAIGLLFLAALYDRRFWIVYATANVTFAVNFQASIYPCRCDPYTPNWSASMQQALMLHLDGWQAGMLNCSALLLSVVIFALPQMRRATERRQIFQPSFGLSQPGANLALASSGVGTGMRQAAMTRPVTSSRPDDAWRPYATSGDADVDAGLDALADTVRIKAITPSTAPKLRLRPRELGRAPYVSVVIPCYNEEGNIRPMYERLSAALQQVTPTYEIIFVNNGSYDNSPSIFEELANRDHRVSILTLSRNFGSQGAYTAGFTYASGDCVVGLDGDIQDPPELIPALVAKWLQGYDVVYGVRARRKGSLPRRIGYKLFYRMLRRFSYVDIPVDASDFGLMDRRVVNVLNEMPERSRLIRGLRAFAGFNQTGIPYERQERYSGITTNSFRALFRWASLGLISFSFAPLDLISYLAGIVVAMTAVAAVVYTVLYFVFPGAPQGFLTLLIAVLFLGAVQLLCLSIIGAYLGKIFEEVKARPRFLVNDVQNDHHAERHVEQRIGQHAERH